MSVKIRPAVQSDLKQLARVNHESWRQVCQGRVEQRYLDAFTFEECLSNWQARFEQLQEKFERLLVAERNNSVAGFCYHGPSRDGDSGGEQTGQIYLLYLSPEAIGTGLGSTLFNAAISELSKDGFVQATLWVLVLNERARQFYSRHGFSPDNRTDLDERTGTARLRYHRLLS